MKLYFTLFFVFVLLTIAFIFGSQNDQLITINYIVAKANIPVAMAVSVFTTLGFFLGLLTILLWKLIKPFRRKSSTDTK
ncbi:lipopolysaccharide assembly protein LapA domain-containing protein [Thalassotalea atypica]|uniref:lipopolysaccharide assembly protein LapA domain-containing protein n=1 Tax=Thalassotalea atypica TaxID=2054316 RepID=UPI002572F720|nr:lipopolysaccharide assembly protein LapA domain-containing protein [Thalassotalea atypica]